MRRFARSLSCSFLLACVLAACSPQYNWREASDNGTHFVVLLPAKPATVTRPIELDGVNVDMTMVAAEVGDTTFAVGTAELTDAAQTAKAVEAMRTALLNNIGGKLVADVHFPGKTSGFSHWLDVEAEGVVRGRPAHLKARLAAKGNRIFQVLIMGPDKALTDEIVETFFDSFKPT